MEQIQHTMTGTNLHGLYVTVQLKQFFSSYSPSTETFIMHHNELLEPPVNTGQPFQYINSTCTSPVLTFKMWLQCWKHETTSGIRTTLKWWLKERVLAYIMRGQKKLVCWPNVSLSKLTIWKNGFIIIKWQYILMNHTQSLAYILCDHMPYLLWHKATILV